MKQDAAMKNYAGRQVDLELLKHVDDPSRFINPSPVAILATSPARIVAGIEKAVQRYVKQFLLSIGSAKLDPEGGSGLLRMIGSGRIQNKALLDHYCSVANVTALASLDEADADTDTYGPIPDDERIVSTELKDLEIVRGPLGEGRVKVHVKLTTAAGEDYVFIIPVAAGIAG